MEEKFKEYALIKSQIKDLEKQAEDMAGELLGELAQMPEQRFETSYGLFNVVKYKTWTYPEELVKRESKLKADKAKAQSTGDATCEEKDVFKFQAARI